MSGPKRQCGTCEHYTAPRDKRLYHGHAYRCGWIMPDIVWPVSLKGREPRADPIHMTPGEGKTCPTWKPQP
jgi:hypothetical protein